MNIIIELFGKRFGLFGSPRKRRARITPSQPSQPKQRKQRRVKDGTYDTPEQFYEAITGRTKKKLYDITRRKPTYAIHSAGAGGYRVGITYKSKEIRSRTFTDIKGAYAFRDRVIQLCKGVN